MAIDGLSFPSELYYLVEHDVWARPEADGTVTVGITALGIHMAGEIYMCRPKAVGSVVEQGRSVAVVELAKAIVSVKSPIDGTVVAVNTALATEPERVHRSPYEQGWIARLAPADWAAQSAALVHGDAVAPAMQHQAWLHRAGPQ